MKEKGVIICVDDEITVLNILKEQLLEYFVETHDVLTCLSGEEALELIETLMKENQSIELIITDQVMPRLKGDELLRKVHAILPETIKILLTGQAGLESAINSINEGGLSRYIEKPWNMSVLKDDIKALIEKYRENVENRHMINNLEKKIQALEKEVHP